MSERIEGVPSHLRLVKLAKPTEKQFVIDGYGKVLRAAQGNMTMCGSVCPIVEPANVYNAYRLEDVAIPEGYERAGANQDEWFKPPVPGQEYLSNYQEVGANSFRKRLCKPDDISTPDQRRIIVRPVKPKTKRVLVWECDINDAGYPQGVSAKNAEHYVGYSKNGASLGTYRIEERPL